VSEALSAFRFLTIENFSPLERDRSPIYLPSFVKDDGKSDTSAADAAAADDDKDPAAPPTELLAFPPLARLLNGLLSGLNELGQWPLITESSNLAIALGAALAVALRGIDALCATYGGRATEKKGDVHPSVRLRDAFLCILVPHLLGSLSFIYDNASTKTLAWSLQVLGLAEAQEGLRIPATAIAGGPTPQPGAKGNGEDSSSAGDAGKRSAEFDQSAPKNRAAAQVEPMLLVLLEEVLKQADVDVSWLRRP